MSFSAVCKVQSRFAETLTLTLNPNPNPNPNTNPNPHPPIIS